MKNDIEMLTNLESIGDLIGSLAGMGEGIDDQVYIEGLLKAAHGKAASAFDIAAAATAKTGRFNHVYEFGTPGITRGPIRFASGTDPDARLYVHTMIGHGGDQDIGFTFRPARQPNPDPTPESTGVDQKYLSKLSGNKYYFWNKARVMEDGLPVSIKPTRGRLLFVPFYGQPPDNPMYNRGYLMWDASKLGPLHARPGMHTAGQFGEFWLGWWSSMGSNMMRDQMEETVRMDISLAMAEATKKANSESMKPPMETNITGAIASAKALFSRVFKAKAAKRNETITR